MGLKVYSAKQWAAAKGIAVTYATQSFDPFFETLVLLAKYDKTKLVGLVHMACDEADQADFENELPMREAQLEGRADHQNTSQRGSPSRTRAVLATSE